MSVAVSHDQDFEGSYRECMALALRHLRLRFPHLEADERLEAYNEVWVRLLERSRDEGFWPTHLKPWLLQAVENHAIDQLRKTERRATEPSDPLAGALAWAADESMEERIVGELDAESYRSLIDSLSPLQREAAKLRFDWGLSVLEIAPLLSIDSKRCYRVLEAASRNLRPRALEVKSGEHLRVWEKLLRRHLAGTASEKETLQVEHLLATSSQAKMIAVEMARQARDLAALLPAPTLAVEDSRARVFEFATTVKQQLADAAASVKQHTAAAAARVDPTPLSGARPGAVAKLVAGCVALGGGGTAICVDQGINPLDALPAVKTDAQAGKPREAKAEAEPKLPLEPVKVKAPEPEPAKLAGGEAAARELGRQVAPSAPAPSAPPAPARSAAPKPPRAAPGEFDLQSSGTPSSGDPGGPEPVQPSAPAPPAGGGGGEFAP